MTSLYLTSIFGSLLICVLSVIWIWRRRGRRDELPHYRGWPVVGNLFQVRKERPELTFTEWAKDLGPVFSVRMLHKEFVVLSSFDAIHEALIDKGSSFAGRPNKNSFRAEELFDKFRNITSMEPTPTWRKLKKICHKRIKMYDTGLERIEEITSAMIKTLLDQFKTTLQKSFNPKNFIYNTVMNTIMVLVLRRTFSTDEELFKKMVQFEQEIIYALSPSGVGAELDLCPWLRFFGNKTYKRILELIELRNEIWDLLKQEALIGDQLIKDGDEDDRLVTDLREALAEKDSGLSEKHIRAVMILDMALAGTSTTSNTLCSFMNIISQHPEVQTRLQEEVDATVGPARSVSLTDKKNMPYTQATMLELLRYTSVVPLALPHMAYTDTTIQGKVVPSGAAILMNMYGLHHDEDFWRNPFEFQPERFLDSSGNLLSASHPNRRHLMPFSAGPRVCLGEVLAKSRLFLVISSVAQKFNIRPGEVTASSDPRLMVHGTILSSPEFEIIAEARK